MDNRAREYLSLLSFLYLRHGKTEEATALLESLKAAAPEQPWAQGTLAYAYLQQGRHQDCLTQLDRAGLDGTREKLLRVRALWGLGRYDEARQIVAQLGGKLRDAHG